MKHSMQSGFSLTELVIAMAIMSILTMIAVPSYQAHLQKSRIAMAKADLMELAGFLERQRTVNSCYNGPACDQKETGGSPALIADQNSSVLDMLSDDTAKYYNVTLAVLSNSTFTLRATPDTSTPQNGTGYLEVLHTGQQRWDKNNDGDTSDTGEGNWNK
ncbi:MAG: prepilin-type N-terminal cleavage/methylation domain-containing protein [Gammaproteobacteria bacterium]|nr:prepilin-type N-terminal cleavage/methylation domain-containing protein [Gammaproteobacteria bacterium]